MLHREVQPRGHPRAALSLAEFRVRLGDGEHMLTQFRTLVPKQATVEKIHVFVVGVAFVAFAAFVA